MEMPSSPADDMEIWATVLSDPLDVGTYCSAPPTQIDLAYANYDTMATQQLLEGPQDEYDLDRLMQAISSPTNVKQANLTHEAVLANTQPENDGASAASAVDLLDYIPKSDWRRGCGLRAPRKGRIMPLSTEQVFYSQNAACLQDMPSASEGPKHGTRTNNEHWTPEEVTLLVDGVEEYGVGRWTQLKEKKFSASVRTTGHLKDKWRNLLKAYNGNAKGRFFLALDKTLIERIQVLAAVHPYPKPSRTNE